MPRKNLPKRPRKAPHRALPTPDMVSTLDLACREKRRFPTEKQALHAAETQELTNPGLNLRTYQCQYCRGWHLTRQRD